MYDELLQQCSNAVVGELGSECIKTLEDCVCSFDCKNILEIGFNRGSSALGFLLSHPDVMVYSVDVRGPDDLSASLEMFHREFTDRFRYFNCGDSGILNTPDIMSIKWDLLFIDGDHSQAAVAYDTDIGMAMNIPYILYDDFNHTAHTDGIKEVIRLHNLEILKVYDTNCGQALCKQTIENQIV